MSLENKPAKKQIFEGVRKILSDILEIPEQNINLGSKVVNDLGIDSIDFLTLVNRIQREFGIKFSMVGLINKLRTLLNDYKTSGLRSILEKIEELMGSKLKDEEIRFIDKTLNLRSEITGNDVELLIGQLLTVEKLVNHISSLKEKISE